MYWIPILIIAALCLIGVAWSPVFALVIAVPALVLFFLYIGLSPRADETRRGSAEQEAVSEGERERSGGIWGEKRA